MDKPNFFKDLLNDQTPEKSGQETLYFCPNMECHSRKFYGKRKMSINFRKGAFKCWTCGISGTHLYQLVLRVDKSRIKDWIQISKEDEDIVEMDTLKEIITEGIIQPFYEEKVQNRHAVVELPEDYRFIPMFLKLRKREDKKNLMEVLKYLYSRGLDEEDIWRYKIGYNVNPLRVIIPSYTSKGLLNCWIVRYIEKSKYKYKIASVNKRLVIWNECNVRWNEPVILTEGVFDAMKCGPNAVPLLGSTFIAENRIKMNLSKEDNLFNKILDMKTPKVVLALDNDEPGIRATKKIAKQLLEFGVNVYLADLGKYKDPGEATKEEMRQIIENAKKTTFDEVQMSVLFE